MDLATDILYDLKHQVLRLRVTIAILSCVLALLLIFGADGCFRRESDTPPGKVADQYETEN